MQILILINKLQIKIKESDVNILILKRKINFTCYSKTKLNIFFATSNKLVLIISSIYLKVHFFTYDYEIVLMFKKTEYM